MGDLVYIEDYKGFKIEFNKEDEEFIAENKQMNLTFRNRSLFQLKYQVKCSKEETMQKEVFMETGYFHQQMSRIKILSINKETKELRFKVIECSDHTDYDYPVGKMKEEDYERKQIMPINEDTIKAFEKLKELQIKIKELEDEQEATLNDVAKNWGGKGL